VIGRGDVSGGFELLTSTVEEQAIETLGLTKKYGSKTAVESVFINVRRGHIVSLVGANGAGKTTTILMLLGLLTPTSGSVRLLGIDPNKRRTEIAKRIGFFSPYMELPHRLTIMQNLHVFSKLYGLRNWRSVALSTLRDLRMIEHADKKVGSLSSGERARAGLAKALLSTPEILFLDEPTSSLDVISADIVRELLVAFQKRTGATMLITSHNMREVERLSDFVYVMKGGRVVAGGTTSQMLGDYGETDLEGVVRAIYGV
jgi:ABC-2 type transport system ATP-binding protein